MNLDKALEKVKKMTPEEAEDNSAFVLAELVQDDTMNLQDAGNRAAIASAWLLWAERQRRK